MNYAGPLKFTSVKKEPTRRAHRTGWYSLKNPVISDIACARKVRKRGDEAAPAPLSSERPRERLRIISRRGDAAVFIHTGRVA